MKKIVRENLEIGDSFQIISLLKNIEKIDLEYVIGKTYIISNNCEKAGFVYNNNNKLKLIKDKKIIYYFLEIINQNTDKFIEVSDKLLRLRYKDVYDIFVFKIFLYNSDYECNYFDYNWFIIIEKFMYLLQ